jgi:hypothetical protein
MRPGLLPAALACLLTLMALLQPAPARAAAYLSANETWGNYSPGLALSGDLTVIFDELLPNASRVMFSIDGSQGNGSLDLGPYIGNASAYETGFIEFSYLISASGQLSWRVYPGQPFYYGATAGGTCGGPACQETECCAGFCSPPYPCSWQIDFPQIGSSSISASDGLVRAYNASESITPPLGANNDTVWRENSNTNPNVKTVTMSDCGGLNGWRVRQLQSFTPLAGTARKTVIEPFNQTSLSADRKVFQQSCGDPNCGGIYEDGAYMPYVADCAGAPPGSASWNGPTGEVTICSYKSNVQYTIKYLPPNGPLICAFTGAFEVNSSSWSGNRTESGQASNENPFSRAYSYLSLPPSFNSTTYYTALLRPPLCPGYGPSSLGAECNISASYSVLDLQPSDEVSVSFDPASRTVNATTGSVPLEGNYSMRIPFTAFAGLAAPQSLGGHTVLFSLTDGSSVLAQKLIFLMTCLDPDGDGYCAENGDCNPSDPSVNPNATERCNGLDDNCDGQVDEGFRINESCGAAACKGVYVCSADTLSSVCSADLTKGMEICSNHRDDDCDGEVDEEWHVYPNGTTYPGCGCLPGSSAACGSNVGQCREGRKSCTSGGAWGACTGGTGPAAEVCNGLDDDCDGIIDNVGAGLGAATSAAASGCGCYGGAAPSAEQCNFIDDDCNGRIDDGITCCTPGDQTPCGSDVGACSQGHYVCSSLGQWDTSDCVGEASPVQEVCSNGLDDDCDGETDEGCPAQSIPLSFILVAAGAIVILGCLMFLALQDRI